MRLLSSFVFLLFTTTINAQNWVPTSIANMPEAISNNAVCEAKVNGVDYMYSFGGIDTTKSFQGINLNAFKYNVSTNSWSTISELPDTLGKIAAAASYVKGKIYIIGGYHVFNGGSEVSSSKVHVFDPVTDLYLPDGQDIPTPIDDQAQAVWRDSLIYVITGWSNTGNVSDVQVYDPTQDNWQSATAVPSTNAYRAFGAQAVIVGDVIYYYGGARMGGSFPAQSILRIGQIDPNNPTSITWQPTLDNANHPLYRMIGLANPDGNITFLGGSGISYNYDGLAYTNNQGVPTANKQVVFNPDLQVFSNNISQVYPMDLRGYANVNESTKYICGGMEANQTVTNKAYKLSFTQALSQSDYAKEFGVRVYPNPAIDFLNVHFDRLPQSEIKVDVLNIQGQQFYSQYLTKNDNRFSLKGYSSGHYFIVFSVDGEKTFSTIISVKR